MEITNKDILHHGGAEGEYNPCNYCGISFSHTHKAGTPPKEFVTLDDKSTCKHCKAEYNYVLSTGYCDGCLNYIKHI